MFVAPDDDEFVVDDGRVIARHSTVNLDRVDFLLKSVHEDKETGVRYPALTFRGINHKWVFRDIETRDATLHSLTNLGVYGD